ncbi:unnamed protein product [Rotaria socialis]
MLQSMIVPTLRKQIDTMASTRQQRKIESKTNSSNIAKSKSSSNTNILILAIAFAALVFYVLYQSINIYSKDQTYNDFE